MARINPIRYTVFNKKLDNSKLPIIETSQANTVEGSIDIHISGMTGISSVDPSVYRLLAPTGVEARWSKIEPELYSSEPEILWYDYDTDKEKINWRFDANQVPSVAHGDYYGLEFSVNEASSAAIAQYTPDLVIEVNNRIDFTGITGAQGSSFFGITGPQGATGADGATGPQGESQPGTTGLQGETGIFGFSVKDEGSAATGDVEIQWGLDDYKKSVSVGETGTTFYMTNAPDGSNMTLSVSYEANEVPGFTGVKWADGTAPIMSGQTGLVDLANFYYDGSTYYGQVSTGFDYE